MGVIDASMQHEVDVPISLDWERMYERLPPMVVTSSARAWNRQKTVSNVVSLVSQGRMGVSHLLTHRMPFERVNDAFEIATRRTTR